MLSIPSPWIARRQALLAALSNTVLVSKALAEAIDGLDKEHGGPACSFCQRSHTHPEVKHVFHQGDVSICDICTHEHFRTLWP